MPAESYSKVDREHLQRDAFLYVRQSTPRQVLENAESTKRQYALRDRAVALGWPIERIHVIDNDQGHSGAQAQGREGFQQLVSQVAMGHAGIVMGLEVSRLARNCADWHRLIELCAITTCLILDEEGVYDPAQFNDRLLLGLKGTMSEAELHIIKARLRGGILNKARRGELEMRLPIGLVYRPDGHVDLDPDQQIQGALRLVFATFEREGSAMKALKLFRAQGILFPRRLHSGVYKGDVVWCELLHSRLLQVLHNPRYAGAFVFGRTRTRPLPDGGCSHRKVRREDWQIVIPDVHPGYLSWEQYEANLRVLAHNAGGFGFQRKGGAALLALEYRYRRQNVALSGRTEIPGTVGSLTAVRDLLNSDLTQDFSYDGLSRLTAASAGDAMQVRFDPLRVSWQNYTYDRFGNRTKVHAFRQVEGRPSCFPFGCHYVDLDENNHDGVSLLEFDASTNRITTPGYAYDAAGNLIRGMAWFNGVYEPRTYKYDAAGRLMVVHAGNNGPLIEAYKYGVGNQRLGASPDGTYWDYFVWLGNKNLVKYASPIPAALPVWSESTFYLGERHIATERPEDNAISTRSHFADQRGISLTIATKNGVPRFARQGGRPFGTESVSTFEWLNTRRFTSYDRGGATGLDDAVNRQYSARHGRFLQTDPLGKSASDLSNPQTFNSYSYVNNDPINAIDPTGLSSKLADFCDMVPGSRWVLGGCEGGLEPVGFAGTRDYSPSGTGWGDDRLRGYNFKTASEAAIAAICDANPAGIFANKEFGGWIYKTAGGTFDYTAPMQGSGDTFQHLDAVDLIPGGIGNSVGTYHTHGDYSTKNPATNEITRVSDASLDTLHSNEFSEQDRRAATFVARRVGGAARFNSYLGTPSGAVLRFDPSIAAPETIEGVNCSVKRPP